MGDGGAASRKKRMADAATRHAAMWPEVRDHIVSWRHARGFSTGLPPIPSMVMNLEGLGFTASRGGPVTYRTVQSMLERYKDEIDALEHLNYQRRLPNGGGSITVLSHVRLLENYPPYRRGSVGMVIEMTAFGKIVVFMGHLDTGEQIVCHASDLQSIGY